MRWEVPLGLLATWPAVAGMVLAGLPGALPQAGLITLFQRNSEDSYRGRIFGAINTVEGVTILAGTLAAGYLSRVAGIIPVLAQQGGGYVVAGLVLLIRLAGEQADSSPAGTCARQASLGPAV
jgi:hypothetical protein